MAIEVSPLRAGEDAAWRDFAGMAVTATLFHDLDFLAYHPPSRHDFHHLLFRADGAVIALLPGGLRSGAGGIVFASPVGASFGGFALSRGTRSQPALGLADALIAHAREAGWTRLEITLPPPIYNGRLAELPRFALSRAGFTVAGRQLCPVIPLDSGPDLFARGFHATAANRVRASRRAGATVLRSSSPERFLGLFDRTYARLGAVPTHSGAELADLAQRLPGRVAFHVTVQDGTPTGGICVFRHNPRVGAVFYICPSPEHPKASGTLVALADALDDLAGQGVEWLDLGPSASHTAINPGVMAFKETLGIAYQCRERLTLDLPR